MAKLIATNSGDRAQAVKVHGGHTIVPAGRSIPVEPYPDLDEKRIAHFATRGVTFKPDKEDPSAEKPEEPTKRRSTPKPKETAKPKASGQPDTSAVALIGSDLFPALVEIAAGKTVQLGEIVALSQEKSGLSIEEWNALPEANREAALTAVVDELKAAETQQQP